MEMLFYATDRAEVETVREALVGVGIVCELRQAESVEGIVINGSDTELWVQNDADWHRALMVCVELGLGFSKRPQAPDLVETGREP
ncbi:hypothetical protein SBV1_260062 [Verrucomicrobia bacterium]|nr:hypothetical protein SBV1_260062 [Verrucomicrobiota bacterium]